MQTASSRVVSCPRNNIVGGGLRVINRESGECGNGGSTTPHEGRQQQRPLSLNNPIICSGPRSAVAMHDAVSPTTITFDRLDLFESNCLIATRLAPFFTPHSVTYLTEEY